MEGTNLKFMAAKQVGRSDDWDHVLESKTLYIYDSEDKFVTKVVGKEQLLQMCSALGIVGSGVRL